MSEAARVAAAEGTGRGLRAPGTLWPIVPEQFASCVLRVDPADGACGVFRDAPVIACFLRPADRHSLTPETFLVLDEDGSVPGEVWTSADGRVAVWTPGRLLASGRVHGIRIAGVRDRRGCEVSVHESAFVPGDLALGDLGP